MVAPRPAPTTTATATGVVVHGRRRRTKSKMSSAAAIEQSLTSRYSEWAADALDDLPCSFLITDPSIPHHPIVFASRGFLSLSGYPRDEVLGRNARIFQGPATDRRSILEIREAIREERPAQIELLNYTRAGAPHWILFHLFPVFGADDGRVVHFVAVQVPIRRRLDASSGSGAVLLSTCRDEVLDASVAAFRNGVDRRRGSGLEAEERREASDWEKQKAAAAAGEILTALTRYSRITGKPVCGKRCAGAAPFSSSLTISLGRIKQSFVLIDPHSDDTPIVYCSEAFLSLTGYSRQEILGRNYRFLNGPDTDTDVVHQTRESIQAGQACTLRILSYRKDGSSFWNLLHMSPVRNASGKIAYFVGVQTEDGCKHDCHGLSPEMRQLGVVGAVKVAVRSLSAGVGPSRS